MYTLLYSWSKVIFTLGFVWPIVSFITEKIAHRHMLYNGRLPDVVHICTGPLRNIVKPFSRVKDFIAFFPSIYTAVLLNLLHPELFDSFCNFMCGLVFIRCLFFTVTILPSSAEGAYSKSRLERIFIGGCHDLIFSGHVSYCYGALLFLQHHNFVPGFLPLYTSVLIAVVSVILRDHYTVDVLVVYPVVWTWQKYMLK